ncbi:hypothetical protein B0T24DRAFT_722478 [Lasiosphaeria ovina]|uniref:Uncharacterized protein n=1 Tax=Lasiosphaeria ovina TaxID=92902 RepID=A0AAE0K5C5_9PEZI|nr:hypothetical protein B0T24DRAFT_722478 [Lasiosphaeria ovina]
MGQAHHPELPPSPDPSQISPRPGSKPVQAYHPFTRTPQVLNRMKPTVAAIPLLLSAGTTQVYAEKIYIDKVPGYSQLPPCAEVPVSTIVRDMERGCGDGGRYTSFSCFCTASSSKFASIISTAVAARCAASGIASQGAGAALRAIITALPTLAAPTLAAPTLAAATATPAISSSVPTDTAVANSTDYSPVWPPTAPVPFPTAAGARVGVVKILPWACGAALALAVLM